MSRMMVVRPLLTAGVIVHAFGCLFLASGRCACAPRGGLNFRLTYVRHGGEPAVGFLELATHRKKGGLRRNFRRNGYYHRGVLLLNVALFSYILGNIVPW